MKNKILLALLPYWEPQIPPLGIASLKSFLQAHGYVVKIVDANTEEKFSDIHERYFGLLERYIPESKRGNFRNVGQDVLRQHLMVRLNRQDDRLCRRLCRDIVEKIFYTTLDESSLQSLLRLLDEFYFTLEAYFIELLNEAKPDILGLSVYRGNLAPSMFALKLTRQSQPHIKTLMGGAVFAGELAWGSENLDYFLERTPYIDKIFIGEGEILMLEYLKGELPEAQRVYTLNDIGGRTLDLTADSVKIADFSDLDIRFYPNMAVYASRSCPFQCSFCTETVYWGQYREKPPCQVVEDMSELNHRYGSQLFLMCDSLLNPLVSRLADTLSESGLSFYWDGYLRVDSQACDRDFTFRWRRGGFYRARLGIESGSPHVLELMNKKITIEQIRQALSSLAAAGIKTTTYWVIGHPGETETDFQQTLTLIEEMRDDIYEAWGTPFNYYKTGQVDSGRWSGQSRPLYSPEDQKMLIVQSWRLEVEPSREEAYHRMNRFVQRCRELGIPNPYSMVEFVRADERWQRLHRNAVPSLADFDPNAECIREHKSIRKVTPARKKLNNRLNFDF